MGKRKPVRIAVIKTPSVRATSLMPDGFLILSARPPGPAPWKDIFEDSLLRL